MYVLCGPCVFQFFSVDCVGEGNGFSDAAVLHKEPRNTHEYKCGAGSWTKMTFVHSVQEREKPEGLIKLYYTQLRNLQDTESKRETTKTATKEDAKSITVEASPVSMSLMAPIMRFFLLMIVPAPAGNVHCQ